jgi:hypothetical protein
MLEAHLALDIISRYCLRYMLEAHLALDIFQVGSLVFAQGQTYDPLISHA